MKITEKDKKLIKKLYHFSLGDLDLVYKVCNFKFSLNNMIDYINNHKKYFEVEKLQNLIEWEIIQKFKSEYFKYGSEKSAEKYFELMFDFQTKFKEKELLKKNNISKNNTSKILEILFNTGINGGKSAIIQFLKMTENIKSFKKSEYKSICFYYDEYGDLPDAYYKYIEDNNISIDEMKTIKLVEDEKEVEKRDEI